MTPSLVALEATPPRPVLGGATDEAADDLAARAAEVCAATRGGLARLLARGAPVDPAALAGWTYRGTSLGLPGFVDRLAWKTFAKVFRRDPGADGVRGWNVRVRQGTPPGALEPLRDRAGRPRTFGHYRVVPLPPARELPLACPAGVLLDYGQGGNGRLDPVAALRDPLVALVPGDPRLLLGCSLVRLLGRTWRTPSYFLLERHAPLDHEAWPPRSRRPGRWHGGRPGATLGA